MINLKCSNCNFVYLVSEKDITDYGNFCIICGNKLQVDNLDEVVKKDIYQRAEEYINTWVKELGLEGCIELLERNKNQACYRIYKEILEKRGFKIRSIK